MTEYWSAVCSTTWRKNICRTSVFWVFLTSGSLLQGKVFISFVFVFLYLVGIQWILTKWVHTWTKICGGFHISSSSSWCSVLCFTTCVHSCNPWSNLPRKYSYYPCFTHWVNGSLERFINSSVVIQQMVQLGLEPRALWLMYSYYEHCGYCLSGLIEFWLSAKEIYLKPSFSYQERSWKTKTIEHFKEHVHKIL